MKKDLDFLALKWQILSFQERNKIIYKLSMLDSFKLESIIENNFLIKKLH